MLSHRFPIAPALLVAVASIVPAAAVAATRPAEPGPTAVARTGVRLDSLAPTSGAPRLPPVGRTRRNPLAGQPGAGKNRLRGAPTYQDQLALRSVDGAIAKPAVELGFAGLGNPADCDGCVPPGLHGDVGPHHYLQAVTDSRLGVFSKSGELLGGPYDLSDLWSSGGCVADSGAPSVHYDPLADRWLLAQVALPRGLCLGVSVGPDPLGAYRIYDFESPELPGQFRIGVGANAYFVGGDSLDVAAWAFERDAMLCGEPARSLKARFAVPNPLVPADVDGTSAPPAGSPGWFYTFVDGEFHGASDRVEVYSFGTEWAATASGSFALAAALRLTPFNYTVCGYFEFACAPQPGANADQALDVVSEWPTSRLAYRNLGGSERMVGAFTVNVEPSPKRRAGIRWFEASRAGAAWTLVQEGTFDPDEAEFRFLGSIAQDHLGGTALGFTASSSATNPSLRIAVRRAGDESGRLGPEVPFAAGGGIQTAEGGLWGESSAMSIDPIDDCTFWYSGEYYAATSRSAWSTRIGSFRIPGCDRLFFDGFENGTDSRWNPPSPDGPES